MSYQVLLFYKYVTIPNPQEYADVFRRRAAELGFTGRVLISEEGINATLEGETEKTECFLRELMAQPILRDLRIKRSTGDGKTFPSLSVKVRKEIVGTQFSAEEADPRVQTAPYISSEKLHEMYEKNDENFIVIDMRNSYEFAVGHFKNSIDPGMDASRDLKEAVCKLEKYKDTKIITVCTGGIRCEKMSAYLLSKGFTNVQQLEDGMHAYMEKYPGKDFLGALYVFDNRLVINFGGDREIIGECFICKNKTERYTNCGDNTCHRHMLVCTECAPQGEKAYCNQVCREHATQIIQVKKEKNNLAKIKA
ncbi:rhodanese-related sulfurtransferase [Candidatus Uhrbacteria bacterium]|nr:rhodanese-related sulfurtransferase [Candidatus Uhrbacteria bacterium]